ncbi:alkanesulfonate monooxygenase [Lampropedia hyalina DSM 16112]|jgi:alkanesulfonate monooxygenase|uniref:Alkanesulfonate monooxygenase n=1 Tax=Lampropedia hyalina DSM 16112 TaxID=1122156 RepID=A0A1M4Y9X1_9BURK|nr:LLM class flavin-dependent oxidoreductase [Lampropedia hyalina]SHF02534.1 alkanesulfonate monooxygenase [Lampropedia hyalina DSM 16112]
MSVQIVGMIQSQKQSEIWPASGPAVDRDYVRDFAQAHENAGFDRILVPHHSVSPSAAHTIAYAASVTQRIHFLQAHRPGFVAPTYAARDIASLDQFTGGRLAVHFISGGSDAEQRRDGDYLNHDERYARTDEYIGLLRRLWTADAPFSHEGRYYRFENGWSDVRPAQQPHVPIFFGGASDVALEVAGRHADVYALWGESLGQVAELTSRVRAQAALHGREIGFSISFRPILAETEEKAWQRAADILQRTRQVRAAHGLEQPGTPLQSEGARRLLQAREQAGSDERHLWTDLAELIGGRSNSTALVGTPEQVANALLRYVDLGVNTLLIRGFDPLDDAIDYGRELIPRIRAAVQAREQQHDQAAA